MSRSLDIGIPSCAGATGILKLKKYASYEDITFDFDSYKHHPRFDAVSLVDCVHLKRLTLLACEVTNLNGIEFCSGIEHIYFNAVDLRRTDLSVLGQLPNLVHLSLRYVELPTDARINHIESLRRLELRAIKGPPVMEMINGMRLTHLSLSRCNVRSLRGLCVDDLIALNASHNHIR